MKILLLYPPRENYIFGITPHVHIDAGAGFYPPTGMLYIAAVLRRDKKHEVSVLDAYTQQFSHASVAAHIKNLRPDIVGIYCSTYYLPDALLAARSVKEANPAIVTVIGGPHVTLYPGETIRQPDVDYVMAGESEYSFAELADCLEQKKYAGIEALTNVLARNSPADKILSAPPVQNLDSLPFPARDLIDYRLYRSILTRRNPMTTVITSRGCPYSCNFCSNIESGKKVRYRSAGNVADELEQVHNSYGISDFLFFDELFTSNKKRVHEICDEILRRKLSIRWHCRSRADVLDRELVRHMRSAGCRLIQFGIETGSERLQKLINKNLDLAGVRETVATVYDEGIYTYADFIFGFPTETAGETEQTLRYAQSLKLDYVAFGMFHPIPGSTFYEQGLKEGLFNDFWREYVADQKNVITDHSWTRRDRAKFHNFCSTAYKRFYLRPSYIIKKLLRTDSPSQLLWQAKSALKVFSNLFLGKFE